ncbi:MAG: DUF1475 family protein [Cryobacterium sp.]|nr:DUF1475 family protein [Oligoflexia bacterium]
MNSKKPIVLFCGIVLITMTALTTWASLERGVIDGFRTLATDRWGLATLFDAYFAFLTFYLWVLYKERGLTKRLLWLLFLLGFGNFAISAFLLKELVKWKSKDGFSALLADRPNG